MDTEYYVEQESLPPRKPMLDPDLRNGLKARRLHSQTELQPAQAINWSNVQGNPADNSSLLALLENFEQSLGFSPLNPANNLSDVANIDQALVNLGLYPGGANDIWLLKSGGAMSGILILAQDGAQFQANDNLPTAQAGMAEFDGEHLYFTHRSTRRPFSFLSDPLTASEAVNNTTTETEIYAAVIDASILAAGSILRPMVLGHYSNTDGTSTFTLRFKVNGTTLLSIVSTAAAAANKPFFAELIATVRSIGATGTLWPYLRGLINNVNKDVPGTATTTIDTTTAITLSVTIEWSATDAGNTFSIDQALLNMN